MADGKLRAAILVVSDTASKDPSSDRVADTLTATFAAEGSSSWEAPTIKIVPDNVLDIQRTICSWTDGPEWANLVLISGGTGFAVKDNTPEAVSPLIHRHAPGLVHGMLAASLKVTPFAMMSRPVAGVRDKSLLITLPGSPKGAKENLEAIIKLLPHACTQAAGADSRALHAGGVKKLEAEAGVAPNDPRSESQGQQHDHHHHHHHHGHSHAHGHVVPRAHTSPSERPQSNDPNAGPNRRYRSSPYPMLSVDEALKLVSQHTPDPVVVEVPVTTALVGSVIAEDVYAGEAVPAYRASIVDGYAVIAPDSAPAGPSTKGIFPVASITHANPGGALSPLEPGTVARITTGAPLPPNSNAVVMVEDTVLVSSTPDGQEEATIEILTGDIKPLENVREPGSDIPLGSKILRKGDLITSVGGEIGLLAATGTRTVKVYKKPCVGVLSTGDELVEHNDPSKLYGGQIRDSNRPSLLSCLASWGFPTVDLGIARDTPPGELENALRDALRGVGRAHNPVDVIVTTGGVSMGELDLLKPTIERSLGGTIHFGRVAMKPGKPTTFATVPFKPSASASAATATQQEREAKLIFSLPGNPASALVTLNLFVLPSLHKLMGLGQRQTAPGVAPALGLPLVSVVLAHAFPLDPKRTEYHRGIVSASQSDGRLYATSTGLEGVGQRSSRVGSLASANALLVLQPGSGTVEKGTLVEALLLGNIVSEV
ncbi:bifunctional molybdopterin adenylyltransferase MobB/molybdopterin molybdotransferase MoeA family protein [Aspergillus clavatus NRRL 1]|uniref:Molybdenum cofactor biosynthesis protein Gephyrin, putative n=1 Tax=Aspergillus clavatus (strain ATCC 1007 / CBS 513.65 / DSM 816 / NCTC 3887 / NRRL 1 / QM 1276 / 107) TaxID=344612 RepID=A1C7P1_ASPCL|nr:molybdenum cofactor biosynthesis protein Gephyrin, putative [Aspergillus clavatus NRRL 1]EAW14412.1 molybdenum cofactor biosynthesis protein Gephyrin, putative [Aspergillus clavatus NRRL 1]